MRRRGFVYRGRFYQRHVWPLRVWWAGVRYRVGPKRFERRLRENLGKPGGRLEVWR